MKLHPTTVVQHKLYQDLATALIAPTTLVFADTNVLFWLFGLGSAPRKEFLKWANDELDVRFLVPVWAAHELYGYLRSKQTALTPLKSSLRTLQTAVDQVKVDIARAADERHLRDFADVPAYQAEVDRAAQIFLRLCARTPTSNWEDLAAEIIPFVNRHVLNSNIFPILRWIDAEVAARIEGRIPPGFADRAKDDNKFGDRMLWKEIVDRCQWQETPGAVVVLTNDHKEDWVYKPAGIQDAAGGRQGNRDAYETVLPSPLLVHELTTRTKMTDLHILNIETLIVVLHRFAARAVPQLFRAVQPLVAPTGEELVARLAKKKKPLTPVHDGATADKEPAPVALPALAGLRQLPVDPHTSFIEIRDGLASADPFQQDQAVNRFPEDHEPRLTLPEWFALGRALHGAAAAGLQSAMNALANLSADGEIRRDDVALFAGALDGLYLDDLGKRRRLPLSPAAEVILIAAERPPFAPAVIAIREELDAYAGNYLALPLPSERSSVSITLALERAKERSALLLSMTAGERDLLEDMEVGESDGLNAYITQDGKDGYGRGDVAQLRRAVAARYSIPQQWLLFEEPDNSKLKWPNTKGFRRL